MKNKYPLLLILLMTGCAVTSFINTVDVSLNPNNNAKSKLIAIVEEIADKHSLTKDNSESIPGEKICYFGTPYHYYIFELQEIDNIISITLIHEARLSSNSTRGSEPEKEFLEVIRNTFNSDIIDISYHFNEQ